MLGLRSRRLHTLLLSFSKHEIESFNFVGTQMGFLPNNSLLLSRSSLSLVTIEKAPPLPEPGKDDGKGSSFTVSYLVNSCGLSLESAESISCRMVVKDKNRADQVIGILRDSGLAKSQVLRVVRKLPQLLVADPSKFLVPKLDFLRSMGVSNSDIAHIVCRNPDLLTTTLKGCLVACYDVLKGIPLSHREVVRVLLRWNGCASRFLCDNLCNNLSLLRRIGVPHWIVKDLVIRRTRVVFLSPELLSRRVHKVVRIGFDPSDVVFVDALEVVSLMEYGQWEPRMELFRRWGLSDNIIWLAIRKFPRIMAHSEKKITNIMLFLVDRMGWRPLDVVAVPSLFCCSLEKRIAPRCFVVRVLLLKHLITRQSISLSTILISPDEMFLDSFVTKYQAEVPQLWSIYRRKTSVSELGFGSLEYPHSKK